MGGLARFAKRYFTAVAGSAYAFTLGVRSNRHRALIARIATHFGYDECPVRLLPVVGVSEVTSPFTPVTLAEPEGVDGNVSLLELLVISRLVRERAPATIFEIGTFDGRTTLALAMNSPTHAVVHTLDLPAGSDTALPLAAHERLFVEKSESGARLHGYADSAKVRQLYGDSATFDFTAFSAQLVFVDASHSYGYVLEDSASAVAMVQRAGGGIVLWHDYGSWEGVTRALNELYTGDARFRGLRSIRGTTLAMLPLTPVAEPSNRASS